MPTQRPEVTPAGRLPDRPTPTSLLVQTALWTSTLLFWSSALDPFATFKVTAITLCAIALLVAGAMHVVGTRRAELRGPVVLVSLVAFLAIGLLTTVVSSNTWRSLMGQRGRATGYATYVVVGAIFVVIVGTARRSDVRRIASTIAIVGAVLTAYALLQRLGLDPLHQRSALYGADAPIGTLGNANFVSGVGGIALPLLLWRAIEARTAWLRAAFGAAGALTVVGVVATRSVQGVLAGGLGVALVAAFAVLPGAGALWRRRLLAGGGVVAVIIVLLVGSGLAGRGPLRAQLDDVGRSQRLEFWGAAASMVEDHPVLGVGFDQFGSHYRQYRSEKAALEFGIFDTADEPHNVPLGMAAGGGLLLVAAYAAFVAAVGVALVRGLRNQTGAERAMLAGCGGAWLAYQAQAFVSIDGPPLSLLHFVLAGLVLVLVAPAVVVWEAPHRRRGQRRRDSAASATQPWVLLGGILVALVAGWFAILPLRAELAAGSSLDAAKAGDGNTAVLRMQDAHRLVPREAVYQAETGRLLGLGNEIGAAARYYGEAVVREPRNLSYVLPYARLLARSGDKSGAATWYRRALVLEPHAPELRLEVAKFELSRADWRAVLRQLRPALQVRPDDPALHLVAGDAYVLAGKLDEADRHYDLALELTPNDAALRVRLAAAELARDRTERGIQILRQCTETYPDAEECWLQLGEALRGSGDRAGARSAYERALTFTPRDPRADAGLQALDGTAAP